MHILRESHDRSFSSSMPPLFKAEQLSRSGWCWETPSLDGEQSTLGSEGKMLASIRKSSLCKKRYSLMHRFGKSLARGGPKKWTDFRSEAIMYLTCVPEQLEQNGTHCIASIYGPKSHKLCRSKRGSPHFSASSF